MIARQFTSSITLTLLFLTLVAFLATPSQMFAKEASTPTTTVTIDHKSVSTSPMAIGATHERNDADSWHNAQAVSSAYKLMQNGLTTQNQHMMGWGVGSPEPAPGIYDFSGLDARVQMMRDTHAQMVITFCGAPSWMRPAGYQDDWKDLEIAPSPEHVKDFADLAKKIAQRYPDVKYFQVWNEFKGMWSDAPGATPGIQNRWDYERYTTLYNAVYDAVKSTRPDANLGGPYVVTTSDGDRGHMSNPGPSYKWGTLDQRPLDAIRYWLDHKHGAQFITVDTNASNDDGVQPASDFVTAQKFADVAAWIRKQGNGGSSLPIWWAEWYVHSATGKDANLAYYNALQTSAAITTLKGGISNMMIWQPEGDAQGFSFREGLWTSTNAANGGKATPFYASASAFKSAFGPGAKIYATNASSDTITVLASSTKTLLVNTQNSTQNVIINGHHLTLNPYQVSLITTF